MSRGIVWRIWVWISGLGGDHAGAEPVPDEGAAREVNKRTPESGVQAVSGDREQDEPGDEAVGDDAGDDEGPPFAPFCRGHRSVGAGLPIELGLPDEVFRGGCPGEPGFPGCTESFRERVNLARLGLEGGAPAECEVREGDEVECGGESAGEESGGKILGGVDGEPLDARGQVWIPQGIPWSRGLKGSVDGVGGESQEVSAPVSR